MSEFNPPADDVRETAQTFAEHVGWNWDALDTMWRERFEQAARKVLVRPRGTVTESPTLTRSLTGGERLTPDEAMQHAYAIAVTRAPGRMTWGEALRHFATWMREHDARLIAEVRPRGTVTDAADFDWEYCPGHSQTDLHGDQRWFVQAGTLSPGYVDQYLADGGEVVRRKVGPWETVNRSEVRS